MARRRWPAASRERCAAHPDLAFGRILADLARERLGRLDALLAEAPTNAALLERV